MIRHREDRFPIMKPRERKERVLCQPTEIPWAMIEPHDKQAHRNHSQSLSVLASRGGLSPCEAVAVLEDRRWTPMDQGSAIERLRQLMDQHWGQSS